MSNQSTTADMDTEKNIPAVDAYVAQIKQFAKDISAMIPDDPNGDESKRAAYDEAMLKIYDMPWTIRVGPYSVVIHNEAHLHVSMIELIEDFIDKCL